MIKGKKMGYERLIVRPPSEVYRSFLRVRNADQCAPPDTCRFLRERFSMIEPSSVANCRFISNHASNDLSVKARRFRDREKLLKRIGSVIGKKDTGVIRADCLRGL